MKQITLTQGKVALVDTEDFEWLNQYKWFAHKNNNTYYAARKIRTSNGWKQIYMHREIMRKHCGLFLIDKDEIDHRNRKGLDNRLSNLRIATHQENTSNKCKQKNAKFKYKGVRKDRFRWRATIMTKNKRIHLGQFDNEIEAAEAYDKAAKEFFGEFARTNF